MNTESSIKCHNAKRNLVDAKRKYDAHIKFQLWQRLKKVALIDSRRVIKEEVPHIKRKIPNYDTISVTKVSKAIAPLK